jgi:uncharacterized protein (DUF488 family)
MTSTIFTIGFTKKTAEEFFRLLQDAGVQKVIDVRENRVGQLAGFAKFPDIAFFLGRVLGIQYVHEARLAPSPEIRQAYRKTKDWAAYEKSFLELMEQRGILESIDPAQFESRVALLCSEAGPEKCHRRLVAERLADHWNRQGHNVEVRHLVINRPVARRRRRSKTDEGTHPF